MIDKDKAQALGFHILDSKKAQNPLYENLKRNFPQTINADGAVSLKAIATLLGISERADVQGYELTFSGKGLANALYSTPCAKELKLEEMFCPTCDSQDSNPHSEALAEESQNQSHTKTNTIIKGDNLDVLKLLKSAYSEKIKMIYIDPPYNTKNDNFIYPDDFREDYQEILKEVGLLLEDEKGKWIESEELKFFRNITGSKSHSGWLSFMLPRLKLARDLLKEDGVIFISIDDNEQANLKILCDEIFGEENFVGDLIWNNKYTTSNDTDISYQHEHILIYSKDRSNFKLGLLPRTEKQDKDYKNRDNDPKGAWKPTPIHARSGNANSLYKIIFPNGIEWQAPTGRYPRYSEETLLRLYENGELYFNSNGGIDKKTYLNEVRQGITCGTMWSYNDVGHTHGNNEEIAEILGKGIFSDPKGTILLKRIIRLSTSADSNELILDFFAGSGTTAHAVLELNAEDNGNRQFILVQIDEPIKEDKSKTAYDFCKNELKSENPSISDITIERVKRAGNKIAKEHKDFKGDLGFCVYSLYDKPSLVCDKEGHLKLLSGREGASPSDIARNLAMHGGKGLESKLECIVESKLYKCDDVYCVVECDKEVLEILKKTKNEYIFIDGYAALELEAFLNLKNSANIDSRLRIVY
ncbi:site-specific DNA-methyltransferase [Helicobacter turcicus]|uniref:site-specific DNA-methyltransferase (adenine-specific) n=1 Tax=Helicobacter turcicus TaxID=2867412 RepID=A0ABS7JMX3_9HELI|nr:site-specific DNA-methyltransferase [Helicobacter turcicus]MBX7490749.1 site-specific DNA-methyltransferase [Helicobacter turcicus]MBX7545642.1 site-specific DNA-methyltransferase [Helicobacter turcicus]